MKTNSYISSGLNGKKLAIFLLLAFSTVGSFATLGDGKFNRDRPTLLAKKAAAKSSGFSLRSNYSFRGSEVINTQAARYINLNSVVTYQQGKNVYVLPVKTKVLDKVVFNPNEATRNLH